ncbi:MAG: BamA/TamA family outer membrane protein [Myxococcota bacterium]
MQGADHLRGARRALWWPLAVCLAVVAAPGSASAQGPEAPREGDAEAGEPDAPSERPAEDGVAAEEGPPGEGDDGPPPQEAGGAPSEPSEPAEADAPRPAEGAASSSDGPRAGAGDAREDEPSNLTAAAPEKIRYFVERIDVVGNRRTADRIVKHFVPLGPGDVLDVDDPEIEAIRWQLLGTGWFDAVRLRLERGSRRGWVVLIVEVEERNTFVIEQLNLGVSEGLNSTRDTDSRLSPYGGLSIAETNLMGLGISLSASALFSQPQQGVRVRFADPMAFGSEFLLSASAFFVNARQYFGRDPLVTFVCDLPPEECPTPEEASRAVVLYRRGGIRFGTGHDLGASTRYTLDWQGEWVKVRAKPEAASERFGDSVRPIDFSIEDGTSWVSSLRLGMVYDHRNDPALPTEGVLVRFLGDGATRFLGSDYEYLRLQGLLRWWIPLPHEKFVPHYVRLGAYAGVVFGDPPFFYKFHVSDLTDLIPSRVLQMELDSRPPPNLLNTSIEVMRAEEIAGRFDVEYGVHLYRGEGGVRTLTAYGSIGLYALTGFEDMEVAVPGFRGAARIPVDLTFDVGLRLDTPVGVFQFGFSNLLGFIAL